MKTFRIDRTKWRRGGKGGEVMDWNEVVTEWWAEFDGKTGKIIRDEYRGGWRYYYELSDDETADDIITGQAETLEDAKRAVETYDCMNSASEKDDSRGKTDESLPAFRDVDGF